MVTDNACMYVCMPKWAFDPRAAVNGTLGEHGQGAEIGQAGRPNLCNAVTGYNTHSKQARTAHLRGANVQRTPSQLNRALLKTGQDIYGADLTSRRVLLAVIGAE